MILLKKYPPAGFENRKIQYVVPELKRPETKVSRRSFKKISRKFPAHLMGGFNFLKSIYFSGS